MFLRAERSPGSVSGYGRAEDQRRCAQAGCDLHFTKPVDPSELERALELAAAGGGLPGVASPVASSSTP
ncbi:MAG: hypothetical protein QM765_47790 [Myxococcales bacterium]